MSLILTFFVVVSLLNQVINYEFIYGLGLLRQNNNCKTA